MSNFFKNSDLDNIQAENIVSDTLNNCDDGELYLENSKSESILLDDNKIKNSSYSSDLGYGFRAITGEVVAYSHSNDISKDSILKSKSYYIISLPIEVDTGGMSARSSIGAVDAILIDGKGKVSTGADYRGDDYGEILK